MLLEACADADLYTLGVGPGYEGTALTIAASRGHVEVVRLLVEAGANQETSGGIYGDEVPPLLAAINAHSAWSADGGPTDRHMETAQLLLQAHADLDCRGRTSSYLEYDARPLVAACQRGHVEAARLLLEHGFVDSAATPRPAASAIPHFAPALVAASSSGHVEVIRLMLEAAGLGSGEAIPTKNQKYAITHHFRPHRDWVMWELCVCCWGHVLKTKAPNALAQQLFAWLPARGMSKSSVCS